MKKRIVSTRAALLLASALLPLTGCPNDGLLLAAGGARDVTSAATTALIEGLFNARFGLDGAAGVKDQPGNDTFVKP